MSNGMRSAIVSIAVIVSSVLPMIYLMQELVKCRATWRDNREPGCELGPRARHGRSPMTLNPLKALLDGPLARPFK